MQILAYKGVSLISKLIRWQTRSEYSHIAMRLGDMSIVEAWHKGGVIRSPATDPWRLHTPGTPVEVWGLVPDMEFYAYAAEQFLLRQIGKKYDFRAILKFLTKRRTRNNTRWFCSELAVATMAIGGVELIRKPPGQIAPGDLVASPLLSLRRELVTT